MKPTSERDITLLAMAKDGIKYPIIADKLGISIATVSRLAIKYGLRTGQRRYVSEAMAEKWYKMKYNDGLTGTQIASREPFTIETINMHIQRYKRSLEEKEGIPRNELERAIMAIDNMCTKTKADGYKAIRRIEG